MFTDKISVGDVFPFFHCGPERSWCESNNWSRMKMRSRRIPNHLKTYKLRQSLSSSLSSNHRNCNSHSVCADRTIRILGADLWGLDRLHGVKWNPTPTLCFFDEAWKTKHLKEMTATANGSTRGISALQLQHFWLLSLVRRATIRNSRNGLRLYTPQWSRWAVFPYVNVHPGSKNMLHRVGATKQTY